MDFDKQNQLSLGEAVRAFLKRYQLDERLYETELYQRWGELVGSTIEAHTQRIHFKKGVLTVYLRSSALRQELNLRKAGLLEHINLRLRHQKVDRIVVI